MVVVWADMVLVYDGANARPWHLNQHRHREPCPLPVARCFFATISLCVLLPGASPLANAAAYDDTVKPLLRKYCVKCHGGGDEIDGEVNFTEINTPADVDESFDLWETAVELVSDGVMPPEDEPQPSDQEKAKLLAWYQERFVESVEAHPGFFRARRLSAYEYRNTLHSLLGFELEVAIAEAEQTVVEKSLVIKLLPSDPPGASGFKNDTSGNPLTTVIWDQYSYLVDNALAKLFSPSRRGSLEFYSGALDSEFLTAAQATQMLRSFTHRAFRRTIDDDTLKKSFAAIDGKTDAALEAALRVELKTILMSPAFIYRGLLMKIPRDTTQRVDDFELAERLSYFLWGDMPDDELVELASAGQLHDAETYRKQIDRMLASPKARNLAEDMAVQWFSLEQIENVSNNPPVAEALLSQPIDFLDYLFTQGRPLIEHVDARKRLAQSELHVHLSEVIEHRALWAGAQKMPNMAYGPMAKLFSSEKFLSDSRGLLDLTAPDSLSKREGPAGELNLAYRHAQGTTIYGGTSEVHRSQIAERNLGLPRTRG
jgi:hypothetical protein